MDFFKVRKFRKANKPTEPDKDLEDKPVSPPEEPKAENGGEDLSSKSVNNAAGDPASEADDDDDDFITNEVKRRLKELRRNSFMVLIPEEESCPEDGEEEDEDQCETNPAEWRDVEAEGRRWWSGFDAVYDKYCERMLFFDRMSVQQLNETGLQTPTTPSPRSASKKLTSPFRCLSLKKIEEPEDIDNLLQLQNDPYQDIETAYVAQICLTWEALHCQYTQMSHKISCQPDDTASYNHSAQQFQQFQVLLQRFMENEPFEQGLRPEIYARTRKLLPKLLQVPNIKASDIKQTGEGDSDSLVLAPDLLKIMENSILTFHLFVKMDKKKSGSAHHISTPLQQVQSSLEKKEMKLKEMRRKRKGWKKRSWPEIYEDVQLLFGLIDMKVMSRALRTVKVTKEQLFWCEEKMKKVDVTDGKLQRDPSPILFPCQ